MQLTRDQKFELIGGIFGAAIAYGGVALGVMIGWFRLGVLLLVLTVPFGVVLGWCLAKVLKLSIELLDD